MLASHALGSRYADVLGAKLSSSGIPGTGTVCQQHQQEAAAAAYAEAALLRAQSTSQALHSAGVQLGYAYDTPGSGSLAHLGIGSSMSGAMTGSSSASSMQSLLGTSGPAVRGLGAQPAESLGVLDAAGPMGGHARMGPGALSPSRILPSGQQQQPAGLDSSSFLRHSLPSSGHMQLTHAALQAQLAGRDGGLPHRSQRFPHATPPPPPPPLSQRQQLSRQANQPRAHAKSAGDLGGGAYGGDPLRNAALSAANPTGLGAGDDDPDDLDASTCFYAAGPSPLDPPVSQPWALGGGTALNTAEMNQTMLGQLRRIWSRSS